MALIYNHTDKEIRIKMGYDPDWIIIPPESEFVLQDSYANLFFGFGLETEAQLRECWNRLRVLGNDISWEDFMKIYENLSAEKMVRTRKKGIA